MEQTASDYNESPKIIDLKIKLSNIQDKHIAAQSQLDQAIFISKMQSAHSANDPLIDAVQVIDQLRNYNLDGI